MNKNGIDISQHQRGLQLASVYADFVIIKATEGVGFTDPQFYNFINQALSLDKKIGVYHFARPYAQAFNTPQSEADWFVRTVQQYVGRVMLILDWEAERKFDVLWAKAWLDRVYELTGVRPVFYSYESCVNQYDWSPVAKDYALWVARYLDYAPDYNYDMSLAGQKPSVKWWSEYIMWQWTSSGRLNGWSDNLDCDIFYGDSQVWDAYVTPDGTEPEIPAEPEQTDPLAKYTDEELAAMVWRNEFGKGEERRKVLGSRWGTVQKLVDMGVGKPGNDNHRVYTVKPGDTLSAIAKKYNTTYQRLAMDNHITNPNLIYPGQQIRIKI